MSAAQAKRPQRCARLLLFAEPMRCARPAEEALQQPAARAKPGGNAEVLAERTDQHAASALVRKAQVGGQREGRGQRAGGPDPGQHPANEQYGCPGAAAVTKQPMVQMAPISARRRIAIAAIDPHARSNREQDEGRAAPLLNQGQRGKARTGPAHAWRWP